MCRDTAVTVTTPRRPDIEAPKREVALLPHDEERDERRWIVEPPDPGEVRLRIAVGDGAELTREQEAALKRLIRSLEAGDAEVVGFGLSYDCQTFHGSCTQVNCPTLSCGVLTCTLTRKASLSGGGSGAGAWDLLGSFKRGF